MMIVGQNLHTHTTFCDGSGTAEEMLICALNKGMTSIGFSGHALTEHDTSYCMSEVDTLRYYDEIIRLKAEYADRIKVYLGLEQDFYSVKPAIPTDYLIGSVHYVCRNGEFIPVDETGELIVGAVNDLYNGDVYSFLEDYFSTVSRVYDKTGCDIVGHFDLPEKFNADDSLFDRTHPRYVAAYERAVQKLTSQGCIFEINTGGMSKGYTQSPYPNDNILKRILHYNGKITFSSDSHTPSTIDYKLDEMAILAYSCGFREYYRLGDDGFYKMQLSI